MKNYIVLASESLEELIVIVNDRIEIGGFTPHGGVAATSVIEKRPDDRCLEGSYEATVNCFYQAMVR